MPFNGDFYTNSEDKAPSHDFYKQNMMEYNKINTLPKTQLEGYIKTWDWV